MVAVVAGVEEVVAVAADDVGAVTQPLLAHVSRLLARRRRVVVFVMPIANARRNRRTRTSAEQTEDTKQIIIGGGDVSGRSRLLVCMCVVYRLVTMSGGVCCFSTVSRSHALAAAVRNTRPMISGAAQRRQLRTN